MTRLEIYVSEACWTWPETRRLLRAVAPLFPELAVALHDEAARDWPEEVFATPTYVLDGRVIFLGNPTLEQLRQELTAVAEAQPL